MSRYRGTNCIAILCCVRQLIAVRLDELLEGAVDGRTQRLDLLVKVDGLYGTLRDTLGRELEFLKDCQRSMIM